MDKFILPEKEITVTVLKTIRINKSLLDKIILISNTTNISVNKIINLAIKYALDNLEK